MMSQFFKDKKNDLIPELSEIIFRIFFSIFVIVLVIEYWQPGFVTNYFNPAWLLLLSIISGIITITKYD